MVVQTVVDLQLLVEVREQNTWADAANVFYRCNAKFL